MFTQTLELDTVTQDYLDTYNWYGTLMAIALALPQGAEKEKIEQAIAVLKPKPSIEQVIQEWGLASVIVSMVECARITRHKIECPLEVQEILQELLKESV
jgi:hypothetical protein